jgi:4-hydroxybenzoate polyprenyltransferase
VPAYRVLGDAVSDRVSVGTVIAGRKGRGMGQNKRSLRALLPVYLVGHLAFGGVLWVAAASWYLGCRPDAVVSLVFAGLVFGIYMVNRFTDRREDMANNGGRLWLIEHGRLFFHLGALALAGSALVLMAVQALTAYHLALILLGLAYSYRFIPWVSREGVRFVRLKEIPLMKNVVVAILWGSATFVIPVLFHGIEVTVTAGLVLLVAAGTVTVFTNTVFCDVRDVTGDRLAANRTLPCTIGVGPTYKVLAAINAALLAVAAAVYAAGLVEGGHLLYTGMAVAYPVGYILAHERRWFSGPGVELMAESTPMVCALGLVIMRQLGA